MVLLQGFAKHYRGGGGVGGGKGCTRERVQLPSLSLTIYRGKGVGEGTLRVSLWDGRRPQGKP